MTKKHRSGKTNNPKNQPSKQTEQQAVVKLTEVNATDSSSPTEGNVKKNDKPHWTAYIGILSLIISGASFYFSYIYNSKSNAILDYVGLANFSIKPYSSVYKTITDEQYDKFNWSSKPDDLFGNNMHEFIYYYEVTDSDKNVFAVEHSPYYEIEKVKKSVDTFPWKGERLGINKVYEPKFKIVNNGQSPAQGWEYKVGVKTSSVVNSWWEPMTHELGPIQFGAHDSLYPNLQLFIPYTQRLTDTVFFRVRMHYKNIMHEATDTNFYVIWYPPKDQWFQDNEIHARYGNQPFHDEIQK